MIRENFFTGEPVNSGSPDYSDWAASNASFGQAYYNATRGQPQYQQDQYYQQAAPNPAFQYIGGNGYNPYMNQFNNGVPRQAFTYGPGVVQQKYSRPKTIQFKIQPVDSQEFLPTIGWEDEIEKLKMVYWEKEQEEAAREDIERARSRGYMGYGYNSPYSMNYYGNPYFNPFNQYRNPIIDEVNREVERMKDEARDNRLRFNMNLSKLAHNIVGDKISDDEIRDRYTGKIVVMDDPSAVNNYLGDPNQARFDNLVPFDNSGYYQQKYTEITKWHNNIIGGDNVPLDVFFKNLGILGAEYAMEEERERRRQNNVLYNSEDNSYKIYVRQMARKKYMQKQQESMLTGVPFTVAKPKTMEDYFPTLSKSATMSEDGTLNIVYSLGDVPEFEDNQMEEKYREDQNRFKAFLNSIPGAIYNFGDDDPGGGGEIKNGSG